MKLDGLPESIKPIEDAYKRLRKGEMTQPTPADKNIDLILNVSYDDLRFGLVCPDYGGEQIKSLVSTREIKEEWLKMVNQSSEWLLFLKLHDITTMHDITTKPANEGDTQNGDVTNNIDNQQTEYELSEAPELIELLQMLLHFKRIGFQKQISTVKLKVVITRWDEIHISDREPSVLLKEKLPLLYEFVNNNWIPQNISIWGLSAQGFDLMNLENKEKYLEEGNEKWAFLIRPDGQRSGDITELLSSSN